MPRNPSTGVYTLPPGTGGTPNQPILSNMFNVFVGDVAQDANLARPITAGGTGATNATAARANLGANNASNLTTGTVNDARLPNVMSGKTFSGNVSIESDEPYLTWRELDTNTSFRIVLSNGSTYLQAGASGAGSTSSSGNLLFSGYNSQDISSLQVRHSGAFRNIWHAGNMGAGSGLDADKLDGQEGSWYSNLANATGTLSDARLPSSMSAKTFTGNVAVESTQPTLKLDESDTTTSAQVLVAGGIMYLQAGAPGAGPATSSGSIRFAGWASADVANFTVQHSGSPRVIWHAGNMGGGSGLDADKLDGQEGSYYRDLGNSTGTLSDARLPSTLSGKTFSTATTFNGAATFNANLAVTNDSPQFGLTETDTNTAFRAVVSGGGAYIQAGASGAGAASSSGNLYFSGYLGTDIGNFAVRKNGVNADIWHAENDGAGSGLDADKLEGLHASEISGLRNKLINPAFEFNQRGAATVTSPGGFFADRWKLYQGSGSISATQSLLSLAEAQPFGRDAACVRLVVGTAGNVGIEQRIEDVRTLAGKKATLTFWARRISGSAVINTYSAVHQVFGSGGSPSATVVTSGTVTGTTTTSWSKFAVVFDVPDITAKTIGTNSNDYLNVRIQVSNTGTVEIAHASIVEGDATGDPDPFAERPYGLELALCQRYLELVVAAYSGPAVSGQVNTGVGFYQVMKRSGSPSATWHSAVGVNGFPAGSPSAGVAVESDHLRFAQAANGSIQNGFNIHRYLIDAEL